MFIDLSHPIHDNMPIYPEDPKTSIVKLADFKKDGYTLHELSMGLHNGTHIDFPSHMIDVKACAKDYPLSRFVARACIIDVKNQTVITVNSQFESIKENDIVVLHTGFSQYYEKDSYFSQHPEISKEAALFFVNKKISILGYDMPSCDYDPYDIHKLLLENDILLLENLTNLDKLNPYIQMDKNIQIIAQPLCIKAEASPVRAFAHVI